MFLISWSLTSWLNGGVRMVNIWLDLDVTKPVGQNSKRRPRDLKEPWEHFTKRLGTQYVWISWIFISNYSHLSDWITTKFCTCHDSNDVVACAKFYCGRFARNWKYWNWILVVSMRSSKLEWNAVLGFLRDSQYTEVIVCTLDWSGLLWLVLDPCSKQPR